MTGRFPHLLRGVEGPAVVVRDRRVDHQHVRAGTRTVAELHLHLHEGGQVIWDLSVEAVRQATDRSLVEAAAAPARPYTDLAVQE
jgi:hypothetical protein